MSYVDTVAQFFDAGIAVSTESFAAESSPVIDDNSAGASTSELKTLRSDAKSVTCGSFNFVLDEANALLFVVDDCGAIDELPLHFDGAGARQSHPCDLASILSGDERNAAFVVQTNAVLVNRCTLAFGTWQQCSPLPARQEPSSIVTTPESSLFIPPGVSLSRLRYLLGRVPLAEHMDAVDLRAVTVDASQLFYCSWLIGNARRA